MKLISILTAAVLMCTSLTANAANNRTALQHCYEHDVQGRVTTRTAYAWNGEDWQPALRWTYSYADNGYTVEFSCYDSRHHRFSEPTDKTVYAFTPDATAAYITFYTRNDSTVPYQITDTLIAAYADKTDVLPFIAKIP